MGLNIYNRKRKFNQTPEPKGKKSKKGTGPLRFVVQLHRATRLHYDFRLEFDGSFKSWAVPKGPSLSPLDQRLAVFVEDHPLEYGSFEGTIPRGNYGAGTVMLWDSGTYVERGSLGRKDSEAAMLKNFEKGHITFVLKGEKLNGEFALIRLKNDNKAWLLVKKRDEFSSYKRNQNLGEVSVKTGRTMEEIAATAEGEGNIWISAKKKKSIPKTKTTSAPKSRPLSPMRNSKPLANPRASSSAARPLPGSMPMPRKNKPMIATVSSNRPKGKDWVFEPDLEGVRALAEVEGKRVNLYSRSGIPFNKKYPVIVDELAAKNLKAVLDGEIVIQKKQPKYFVYDLLFLDGEDLRKKNLKSRKALLKKINFTSKHILGVEPDGDGERLIAKNLTSLYHGGTTSDWLKIHSGAPRSTRKPSPTPLKSAIKKSSIAKLSLEEPQLTNLQKIFWPKDGVTKGDLIEYYRSVGSYIMPYLVDRPESLNRQPNGIAAPGFYQKDMTGHIPRWLKTHRIFSESANKSVDYVLCQDLRSLLYIVNLGCIEINPWFSRVQTLEKPDFLVIDLDPDGNDFNHVIEIAHVIHKILDEVGATNFCKTSGATGIHIGVPTGARYPFDQVRLFAETVCRTVAKKFPATTSIERNPARRRRKIYLDFMQNRRGQTLAAPFCVRPHPGCPVSTPLMWKELKKGVTPQQFTMFNTIQRLKKHGDAAWKPVLGPPVDLEKCIRAIQKGL